MFFTLHLSNRRAIYLLMFGAFVLLLVLFFFGWSSPEATLRVKVVPVSSVSCRVDVSPIVFDSEAYYRPIIKNNLFRPLGWTPLVPVEPYRLIGTILQREDLVASDY